MSLNLFSHLNENPCRSSQHASFFPVAHWGTVVATFLEIKIVQCFTTG